MELSQFNDEIKKLPGRPKSPSSTKIVMQIDMATHQDQRRHLDLLFLIDSVASLAFGAVALLTPHGLVQKIGGGEPRCVVL